MSPAPSRAARLLARAWLVLLGVATAGCAGLVTRGTLPPGAVVEELGASDPGSPFAADASGRRRALVRNGMLVLESERETKTLGGSPLALSFSPGARLAASFASGEDSELKVYSPEGALQGTTRLAGAVTSLAWLMDREVVGGAVTLARFTFGTTRTEYLVRWDGTAPTPSRIQIGATTLKPLTTSRDGELAARPPQVAASPLGDEVCFTQLHDPPVFPRFEAVVVRHLESGATRELGRQPWGSGGPAWAADGDGVWFGDGQATRLFHWLTRRTLVLASPGRRLAVSPRGTWVLADGRVFEGSAERLAFAPDAEGVFTARGLLVRSGGRLHLVSSFAEAAAAPSADEVTRRLELRGLRAQGLITPDDYERRSKPLLQP